MFRQFKQVNERVREKTNIVDYETFGNLLEDKLQEYQDNISDGYELWNDLINEGVIPYLKQEIGEGFTPSSLVASLMTCFTDQVKKKYILLLQVKLVYDNITSPERFDYLHYTDEVKGLENFLLYGKSEVGVMKGVRFLKQLEGKIVNEFSDLNTMSEGMFL